MNLTESQKVIGQENFSDVINLTRRDFLTGTLAAGLATGQATDPATEPAPHELPKRTRARRQHGVSSNHHVSLR